jgi:hypothetical protein
MYPTFFNTETTKFDLFTEDSNTTYIWNKPNDCRYVHIIICGGGGGGGSGCLATGGAGTRLGGGGGGGSGAQGTMFGPSFLVPDRLFIRVGAGGSGGAARTVANDNGLVGSAGGTTSISIDNNFNLYSLLLTASGGGGGGAGTSGTGGAAGAAGTAPAGTFSTLYNHLAVSRSVSTSFVLAGDVGTAGGYRAAGLAKDITTPTGTFIRGGTGGGGIDDGPSFSGGAMTVTLPSIFSNGLIGGQTPGGSGSPGIIFPVPFLHVSGGTGGASIPLTPTGQTAGSGGIGILGSGGGGGGCAGTNAAASGAGGRGGNGFVLISTF